MTMVEAMVLWNPSASITVVRTSSRKNKAGEGEVKVRAYTADSRAWCIPLL